VMATIVHIVLGWLSCPAARLGSHAAAQWQARVRALIAAAPPDAANAPPEYREVLRLLRLAATSGLWPPTTAARARVLHGCGLSGLAGGATFTLANPSSLRKGRPPRANAAFPELARAVFALEPAVAPRGRKPSTQCAVSCNATFVPHTSPPSLDLSLLVGLGDHHGGGVAVEGDASAIRSVRYKPLLFDASRRAHWSLPFSGELFTLSWFTPAEPPGTAALEARAARLAAERDPPLAFRHGSTDSNVLCELLSPRGVYSGPPPGDPRWPAGLSFSPRGHVLLDVGAQIGVFSRMALDAGAARVIAVEPEPTNAALCRANLGLPSAAGGAPRAGAQGSECPLPADGAPTECGASAGGDSRPKLNRAQKQNSIGRGGSPVEVLELALAAGEAGAGDLVLGKTRSDGVRNTWRHALRPNSHYQSGEAPGETVRVATIPLFGRGGVLTDKVSFVKLDCEGCELDLLGSFLPGDWRQVERLVFEWSFTKERRMAVFTDVVRRLEAEGFCVHYEGRGTWEAMEEWPWEMDAVVFAARARPARLRRDGDGR